MSQKRSCVSEAHEKKMNMYGTVRMFGTFSTTTPTAICTYVQNYYSKVPKARFCRSVEKMVCDRFLKKWNSDTVASRKTDAR